ncbi:MAG: hypothetical protein ABWK05_03910 [Pyrobaculum sp.]
MCGSPPPCQIGEFREVDVEAFRGDGRELAEVILSSEEAGHSPSTAKWQ